MYSARPTLLAFVAAIAFAAPDTGHADTVAVPFKPAALMIADVPLDVRAAIVVLREACATWRPALATVIPGPAGSTPRLLPPPPPPPERTLCEVAKNPGEALVQPMITAGVAGAILFFLGLLLFSLLRGLLISVWNWRLPVGGKSW